VLPIISFHELEILYIIMTKGLSIYSIFEYWNSINLRYLPNSISQIFAKQISHPNSTNISAYVALEKLYSAGESQVGRPENRRSLCE